MLENLPERVEQLARMAVLTDSADLPGLVAMQEQAAALAADIPADQADEISKMATEIGRLAEAIVLREVSSADEAFHEIGSIIERLQDAASQPVVLKAEDDGSMDAAEEAELISGWIASCEGMLSDVEGWLLTLEQEPQNASDEIADIRRSMHTLKGECGVLAFHTAQQVCHEAETLIDEKLAAGQSVPIDPLLKLLDWLKDFIHRLSADHSAQPTDHQAVLDVILAAQAEQGDAEPTPAAPASDESSKVPVAEAPEQPRKPEPTPTPNPTVPAETGPLTFAPQEGTEDNLADFLCEARDHIAASEEALLALEQNNTDAELINTVFRAFHTIKGVSGFMALKPIVSLAHSAEQLLDAARSGNIVLERAELDLVLASCDMMSKLLDVLEDGTGPDRTEFDTLIERLDAAAAGQPTPSAQSTVPQASTSDVQPEPAEAKPATPSAVPSKLRKADQTVKVNTSRMDNLVTMVGELVIAQQMMVQDISGLMEASGRDPRLQRSMGQMGKMIRDLQEVSMSLRMVTLKGTFQKMNRLVRDVSQKAGKQIEVITEGDDVELDRNVVEAITDPLVHMVRNSCDHGVESAEERKAAGKNPKGRVTLRAYHSGGSIVIEISDDGRGLRRDKLLAKAKAKGLLPEDFDDDSMPDGEVFALVFKPGFSTAEKVTDISGRGVGMDVVRRNIEALRGKVEIRSTPGKGSTFLMQLPLTMAIIDGMVVRVGQQRYVLPTLTIQQSFRPRPEDLKSVMDTGEMVRVRESMLPIYRLNRVLDLRDGTQDIEDALLIVMETHGARFCVMVDEIIGQQQVVIKTLDQTGQALQGVSGGAILGDGRVALILDVAQFAEIAREHTTLSGDALQASERSNARCSVV